MLALVLIAAVTGALANLVIRRAADTAALRRTINRLQAHFLEFRLFFDEPTLIWNAQRELLRDNLQLFRLLLPPTLILALPTAWLFLQLESAYSLRPLHPGEPAIVTAQLTQPIQHIALQSDPAFTIETPPIHIPQTNQIVWRIRPTQNARGALRLTFDGQTIRKSITAAGARTLLSPRRFHSWLDFLLHPEEPRLPDPAVAWIAIAYPQTSPTWILWFFLISTAATLLTPTLFTPRGR